MRNKTVCKMYLMMTILLVGTGWQASAQSSEIEPFRGWVFVDTNDIPPRSWADLPEGAGDILSELILSDPNSALLPSGDGPSGLPSELQLVSGGGHISTGGNTKCDMFGLAFFNFPTMMLYLWEYEVWTFDDGDKLFTKDRLVLDVATMTITGTKTVVGGTGKFKGAVSTPIKTFGGETNGVAALTYDGWIYLE